LIGALVAWKWPLAGGIILGIIGLYWLVFIVVIVITTPTSQAMLSLVFFMLLRDAPLSLPPLASGILFILYWRAERAYLTRKKV
jgi:hypothetical protein